YERVPESVAASAVEPVAMEKGTWRGVVAGSEQVAASGIYSAKWREVGGAWSSEAELFVTLA
ncbi:hypothetical protein OY671_010586, partial [Metschnikowia pulcherrima]